MSPVWQTELNGGLHPVLHRMHRSLPIDRRLWRQDIEGSKVHVLALRKAGLVSEEKAKRLTGGLDETAALFEKEGVSGVETDEDIHGLIERVMGEKLGPEGADIHLGRSRNEQVLLDMRLYLRDVTQQVIEGFSACCESLKSLEARSENLVMPSYTHLRRAQPIFVAQYWHAHQTIWHRSQRAFSRVLADLKQECPMGAGAINGTTLPTKPDEEARLHGFVGGPKSSLATVSCRHEMLSFASATCHWMLDVSRLMEDLVVLSSDEFGYFHLDATVTTGSSMMPQKRNPDICELIRGKASTVLGHYTGLLSLMKGLPMGYVKDLQEDKTMLFPIVGILNDTLKAIPILLDSVCFDAQKMAAASADPLLLATDAMEFLIQKGLHMRQAYREIARLVKLSQDQNQPFSQVFQKKWKDSPKDLFDPKASAQKRLRSGL